MKKLKEDEVRLLGHFVDLLDRMLSLEPSKRPTPKVSFVPFQRESRADLPLSLAGDAQPSIFAVAMSKKYILLFEHHVDSVSVRIEMRKLD